MYPVIHHDHAAFEGITDRKVAASVLDLQIVNGDAADVQNQRTGNMLERLEHGDCSRVRLRIAHNIIDGYGIVPASVVELYGAAIEEEIRELQALCAIMRGRQPHGKLDVDRPGMIPAGCLQLARDGKQGENEVPFVLRFVSAVWDALF